jgi:DNA-directed RNA polymerase subunit RPC12/RpoP
MSDAKEPLCFTCGKAVTTPPRLNTHPSGLPCPACSERVLDHLPSLLPGRRSDDLSASEAEFHERFELAPGDYYPEPPPLRA